MKFVKIYKKNDLITDSDEINKSFQTRSIQNKLILMKFCSTNYFHIILIIWSEKNNINLEILKIP